VLPSASVWITGSVRSGKTDALIAQLMRWRNPVGGQQPAQNAVHGPPRQTEQPIVFAANADNRGVLMQRIAQSLQGQGSITTTTPLAFFESEVLLFWPLVIQQLNLRGYFPYRLRPETEQALALKLWGNTPITQLQTFEAQSADRWVRRILDLIQLAAGSGTSLICLAERLKQPSSELDVPEGIADLIQQLALQWQNWCLHHGLLTYGLITDLFWRYVLPHPTYYSQLPQRFAIIAADDVDLYPAITRTLFEQLLDLGLPGVFTYSELGGIREGLGADPNYLLGLKARCTSVTLSPRLGSTAFESVAAITLELQQPNTQTHPEFYVLQTVSRIQLLQAVAQQVIESICERLVQPQEVAIVGPGLDPLARYTLIDAFQRSGLAIESLRDQRPLQNAAIIRALLTLLALVYPGLGHLLEPEQVAEMLVVLSANAVSPLGAVSGSIDPARAGLLADYCFRPHPEQPELLPIEAYPRWDRLGHSVAHAYETFRQWIAQQQGRLGAQSSSVLSSSYLTLNPVFVLDRAIQTFLMQRPLAIDQLTALRELIETAQHYWDVDARLRKAETHWPPPSEAITTFIQLLDRGVVTANAYPTTLGTQARPAVILATTFQYLNARLNHPWQFWLDAGSQLWQYSGAISLWGSSRFLHQSNKVVDPAPQGENQRFQNTLLDLLGRVEKRVYLCHSDLTVNGQPQMGPLMPWIELALPIQ
jgi:hypothetical protein